MKKFETPVLEVIAFTAEDVITASSEFVAPELGDNQMPYG